MHFQVGEVLLLLAKLRGNKASAKYTDTCNHHLPTPPTAQLKSRCTARRRRRVGTGGRIVAKKVTLPRFTMFSNVNSRFDILPGLYTLTGCTDDSSGASDLVLRQHEVAK